MGITVLAPPPEKPVLVKAHDTTIFEHSLAKIPGHFTVFSNFAVH